MLYHMVVGRSAEGMVLRTERTKMGPDIGWAISLAKGMEKHPGVASVQIVEVFSGRGDCVVWDSAHTKDGEAPR